ncbi:MAG TPA: penicillin-binding protein 1B [Gammaproteobacteria bacterium]|nr:penicillin-binding protein 1B [Gammaproteobacteria bacterium]
MARKRKRGRRKTRRKAVRQRSTWLRVLLLLCLVLVGYVVYLDFQVRQQFDGKRWSLPARVYARPLDLYVGRELSADQFQTELRALYYRPVRSATQPGRFSRNRDVFHVITRPFTFWDGQQDSASIRVSFSGNQVSALKDAASGHSVTLARLDPVLVGSFYPAHNEDRVLLQLDNVPVSLTDALIAIEDRGFYKHHGVAPLAILRALWANVRAGGVVQGGSTLTQQLVKNFFLSSERTLTRKINEAIMALLLEVHYEKDEILEAYLNEVYLGQDGQRAVHGFGLASHFYFEKPLDELDVAQYALLVGLVKGPSYYSPRRHPERARARRNLVLDVMADLGLVERDTAERAKDKPLGVSDQGRKAINTFPAFLDLVRRQLQRDYHDEDITSEGLTIFTTLDPQLQWQMERTLAAGLQRLEKDRRIESGKLEGAAVVTSVQEGEVLALSGGRDAKFAGFNRALDAYRQVGSLLKPAVYLTALEQPQRYTLATLLDDSPLTYTAPNGTVWQPGNYDRTSHGQVPLYQALAHSYNISTARLGLDLGIDSIVETLRRLGVGQHLNPYPSLVLGAVEMSPLQVAGLYETFASGGFLTPLRAINAVLAADKTPLQRYPLRVRAVVEPAPVYLVNTALRFVTREGTARALYQTLPRDREIAGKTGTTDDLRDSWFAGFSGDRLGVVWIGRDDNASTGLTGSSGALGIWRDLFRYLGNPGTSQTLIENIEYRDIDPASGLQADAGCEDAVQLPFIVGSGPADFAPCAQGNQVLPNPVDWFKELFQ